MKKFITAVFLLTFALASVNAQKMMLDRKAQESCPPMQTIKAYPNPEPIQKYYDLNNINTINQNTSVSYKTVTTVWNGTFYNFSPTTPIAYEPSSKAIAIVCNSYTFAQGDDALTGMLDVFVSSNNGASFAKKHIYEVFGNWPNNPSIGVYNLNNTSDVNKLSYLVYSFYLLWEGGTSTSYAPNGAIFAPIENDVIEEPLEIKNPEGYGSYKLSHTPIASTKYEENSIFFSAGMLINNDGYQYGRYGMSVYNNNTTDLLSGSPSAWGLDKFKASDALNSSYNTSMGIDADNNGNLYVGVNNMFIQDEDNRVPGVSKSMDGGVSWEEFNRMPISVWETYYESYGGIGGESGSWIVPYHQDGFCVYSEDNYSFALRTIVRINDDEYQAHIVEAYFQNGSWGMRKIGDYSAIYSSMIREMTPYDITSDSLVYCNPYHSIGMNNELQLAKTADGSAIVAKWIDYTSTVITFDPAITLGSGQVIDTLNSNDVFITYRNINDNSWKDVKNITNDDMWNKQVTIPKIVPTVDDIPAIALLTSGNFTTSDAARADYGEWLIQMIVDAQQNVSYCNLGYNYNSVDDNNSNNNIYSFDLKEATPNPATDRAEIGFSLNQGADTRLEVFDALGNSAKVLINGYQDANYHAVTLNTNDLASGVYYIRLSVNGKSLTKTLSVIK